MSLHLRLFCRIAVLSVLITLASLQAAWSQTKKLDGDRLLDPNHVVEIKIELAEGDWAQLCRQSPNPATAFSALPSDESYSYFRGDIWIDGVKIESVGIRKKGFFGSSDFQRPSLKIKFDEFVKQDPLKGLSRLTLNNNKQDTSQVSQYLVYCLYRKAGNPAPRSNWANVTVNGKSLGIYTNVETIKPPFLKRVFGDKSGNLYEGTLTDFHPGSIQSIEVKTNEEENDLTEIKRLAELLAAEGELDLEELGKIIDLETFFRHWALEALTGFWDGYSSNQNNYYLYFNPRVNGRGYFIPWGADFAMNSRGPFSFGGAVTPLYAQSILANRLYHTPGVPERYRETMRQLLENAWDEDDMLAEIDRIEKLITPHLHQSQAGTPQALDGVRQFIRGRRAGMEAALKNWRPFVPARPRTPAHLVDVGKTSGKFSTAIVAPGTQPPAAAEVELTLELDGKPVPLEQVSVRVQPFQLPRFDGFGFPGAAPSSQPAAQSPARISLILTGTRSDDQPVTLSLVLDPTDLEQATGEGIAVTGNLREGQNINPGGFGNPGRSLLGKLRLTRSGTKPGDPVAGSFEFRVVETRGGFFQQQRPQGGFPAPRMGNTFPAFPPAQPSLVERTLDTDGDGELSAEEIDRAQEVLKKLDRNGDGQLTGDEYRGFPQGFPTAPQPAPSQGGP